MKKNKSLERNTSKIILNNARKLFIQKGFNGTSISDIANAAKINKSLIYHYFENKEILWKSVKEDILQSFSDIEIEKLNFDCATLKEFLEKFVSFRFNLYAANPDLARLVLWQKLEKNITISGVRGEQINSLVPQIIKLQEAHEIRTDIHPEIINYIIFSTASNACADQTFFLIDTKNKLEEYLKSIIKLLYSALKS